MGLALSFDLLQGPAMVLGMMGAALVAGQFKITRRIGFGCWAVGNLLWVVYGLVVWNWYVVVMFGFYWAMAVWGLKNSGDRLPS